MTTTLTNSALSSFKKTEPTIGPTMKSSFNPVFAWSAIMLAVMLAGCTTPRALTLNELTEAGKQRMALLEERKTGLADGVSLAEAMSWAMDNNLALRAEALEKTVAHNNRKLATMGMLPNLTAQAGYSWRSNISSTSSSNPLLVPSTSSERQSTTASLEASWNVLDFGLAWLRARSEGDRALIAEESQRRVAHLLALDVVTAWDRAVAFQHIEPALKQSRVDLAVALRQLEAVAASRLRDPVDVLEQRNALLLILKRMDGLVLQMDQSQDELARLLGWPAGASFALDASGTANFGALPIADIQALQYVALLNRPEIRQSLYAKRAAKRNGYKRIIEQFPSLLFKYGTNYDSNKYLVNNTWDDASASLSIGLMRLASLPLQRRQVAIEREQVELQADLQATAVLSQVAIASKATKSSARVLCLSNAIADTSSERMGLLDLRAQAAALDQLSLVRARVDNMLVTIERDMAAIDDRRATLMMAQSLGIGALPEGITSTAGDERVNAISGWLQGGMQATLAEQLVLVEKEFGISATSQKTDDDKNDTTAGGQSLCQ
jgi:multidrug efflux system outer membrane protein